MVTSEKEIKDARNTVIQFRNSKYSEIKGFVNYLQFELSVNNEAIELVNSHLLCENSVAEQITKELSDENKRITDNQSNPPLTPMFNSSIDREVEPVDDSNDEHSPVSSGTTSIMIRVCNFLKGP